MFRLRGLAMTADKGGVDRQALTPNHVLDNICLDSIGGLVGFVEGSFSKDILDSTSAVPRDAKGTTDPLRRQVVFGDESEFKWPLTIRFERAPNATQCFRHDTVLVIPYSVDFAVLSTNIAHSVSL